MVTHAPVTETGVVVPLGDSRLGDQIDDRVALALDEQFAERPREVRRERSGGAAVVSASAAAGAAVTIFASDGAATLITWAGLTLINLAYHFDLAYHWAGSRRGRPVRDPECVDDG